MPYRSVPTDARLLAGAALASVVLVLMALGTAMAVLL